MEQKVMKPGTTEMFQEDAGTTLEVKNETKQKGEYNVQSTGAIHPRNQNTYVFPNTKDIWVLIDGNVATVENYQSSTTLIVTRY